MALIEYRYDVPFKFTGKINKLTFKLEPEQDGSKALQLQPADRAKRQVDDEEALIFAAVGEAATGLALLIVPSLVGQLLLGEELTGIAIPVARVAGIALIALGIACWPGPPLVGMLIYSAVVALYLAYLGFAGWFDRRPALAGRRPSRDPDRAFDVGHHANATRLMQYGRA